MEAVVTWGIIAVAVALFVWFYNSPDAKAGREAARLREAERQAQIVCPHCQVPGHVTRTLAQRKQGVSGGKATGAIVTGGASLFLTGLSRKQLVTEMTCVSPDARISPLTNGGLRGVLRPPAHRHPQPHP